ncbi:snf7 family protein [Moniliophthora roreri MCA 2997]|uniref:Snf7 family protein n=1 Tax=Moniliophthora roreri (strain MCA 2997) TaxID=1381753 RepID=V2WVE3_MONRO|nr:snf7 family protein [Moniliophthora roreri MCA 2997]
MTASKSLLQSPTYASASRSRLQALYSDFSRQKHSNPASYQSNVEWWRRTLERYLCEQQDTLVLHYGSSLIENLRVEGVGKPIGFSAVIAELQLPSSSNSSLPTIMPLATFLSMPNSLHTSRSAFSYVTAVPSFILSYAVAKPLWWALEQVGVVGEDSITSSITSTFSSSSRPSKQTLFGDYVALNLVEQAGQNIIERQRDKAGVGPGDALYTFESFRREFGRCLSCRKSSEGQDGDLMSELDMKVMLRYLERDKGIVVVDKDVVKFIEEYGLSERTRQITSVDRGIIELKSAVDNLRRQTLNIQSKIEECTSKASEAVRHKRKELAMSYLRSRHQLEDLLKKRLGALENLEGTLIQVEAAAGDIEIVNAYSSSTATLRNILSHPSLQRESIEKTMEAMAEANADAKEVDDAIRIGGDVAVGAHDTIDEDELQAELEGLVREAQVESSVAKAEKETEELQGKLGGISLAPSNKPVDARTREKQPQAMTG